MTKSPRKNVPDVGIELGAACKRTRFRSSYRARYRILWLKTFVRLCVSSAGPVLCATDYNWAATWQNQQNECAPSEDSDQHGHLPSLIIGRVFVVRIKKPRVLSYTLSAQRRLWSDWTELSLRWAHFHFVGFVMSRLICCDRILNSRPLLKYNVLWAKLVIIVFMLTVPWNNLSSVY